jgi:pilus assembly protein CpaC
MFAFAGKTRRRALLAMAMIAASAGAGMLLAATERAAANDVIHISSTKNTSIKIAKGKPRTIKTSVPFYEIVIGDPEVANVNPLTDDSFYVLGNNLGTTGIALFDENKQLVGTVDIEVTLDTDRLASTIRNSVPGGEDIRVSSANGRVVLSGSANDQVAADKASKISSNFSGEEEVINSVNISSSQQVQLNVRFVEINRQVGQELGTKIGVRYLGHDGGISFNSNPSATSNAPAGQIIGALLTNGYRCRHQGTGGSRRSPQARRAEPDRPLRPEGKLPRRRRGAYSGLWRRGPDHCRLQEVRCRARVHSNRAGRRVDLARDRAGGLLGRPVRIRRDRKRNHRAEFRRATRTDVYRS